MQYERTSIHPHNLIVGLSMKRNVCGHLIKLQAKLKQLCRNEAVLLTASQQILNCSLKSFRWTIGNVLQFA